VGSLVVLTAKLVLISDVKGLLGVGESAVIVIKLTTVVALQSVRVDILSRVVLVEAGTALVVEVSVEMDWTSVLVRDAVACGDELASSELVV
jgi:hypothetical protein